LRIGPRTAAAATTTAASTSATTTTPITFITTMGILFLSVHHIVSIRLYISSGFFEPTVTHLRGS